MLTASMVASVRAITAWIVDIAVALSKLCVAQVMHGFEGEENSCFIDPRA